jgi:calcium-dependent protein kinase
MISMGKLEDAKEITDFYQIGKRIGKGSYGDVFKAVHKDSGIERAIKVIHKEKMEDMS